jgi:anaerobic ribonucleoside-triphosphate reductase
MVCPVDYNPFVNFRKRDGVIVPFAIDKIALAVYKAGKAASATEGREFTEDMATEIARDVLSQLDNPLCEYYVQPDPATGERIPAIEDVQDLVEIILSEHKLPATVAAYKRYRKAREKARAAIYVRDADGKQSKRGDITDQSLLLVQSMGDSALSAWDRNKIVNKLVDKLGMTAPDALAIAKEVENQIIASNIKTVNSLLIREMVNNVLQDHGYAGRLRDLSIYAVPREFVESLMSSKSNENSNIVNNNPEAVNLSIAELVLKQWGLDAIFSPEVKAAHDTGAIHIHDLGYPHRVYCSSHSIEYIKKYGLCGLSNLSTESNPARSASVLTGHLNTYLASMQANYAGALGIAYINIFYAPYLVGMNDAQIKQIAQELIFNGSQNAFSRGGQTLFLDFNIHTGVPNYMKTVPAVGPGGKYQLKNAKGEIVTLIERLRDDTDANGNKLMDLFVREEDGSERLVLHELYNAKNGLYVDSAVEEDLKKRGEHIVCYGEYLTEARRFTSALLKVWGEGDRNGRIFEFPKCDFHVSKETFEDPEQYKIFQQACELASHNGSTYFIFDRDEVTLSACCRLRTTISDNRMLRHPECLRFCGFQNVTINLPQCAFRASRAGHKDYEGVIAEIDKMMDLVIKAHMQKRKMIALMMSEPGRPLWQVGKIACDGRPYIELDKVTYIIGMLGMNDMIKFMTGKEMHESDEAYDMALRFTTHMYLKVKEYTENLHLKFTLEESPAESAARRLAKADLLYYRPEALTCFKGDSEDVAYYTNSIHLTAEAPVSLVERIRKQAVFHSLIESGAMIHAFVGEEKPSAGAISQLIQMTFERTQAAQVTISPEFTYCQHCGHQTRGLHETCVQCGSSDVFGLTRVVGYFSKIQNWNKSKRYGELVNRHRGDYAVENANASHGVETP